MQLIEIARMAFHNLWTRKARTALNLLGVVISCIMLLLTFAGTRGASNGMQAMIDQSEDVRMFSLWPNYDPQIEVPEDATRVTGELSDERRERIQRQLREAWLAKNFQPQRLDQAALDWLRQLDGVESVLPQARLDCQISIGEQSVEGFTLGVLPNDRHMPALLVAGEMMGNADPQGALLSEFAAYQLGFVSDQELASLIGKTVEVKYQIGGQRLNFIVNLLSQTSSPTDLFSHAELLLAIRQLVDQMDKTDLTERQRELIRNLIGDLQTEKLENQEPQQADSQPPLASEPIYLTKRFVVRGVIKEAGDENLFSFLSVVRFYDGGSISIDSKLAEQIFLADVDRGGFWQAIVTVDDLDDLEGVIQQVEQQGFATHSAVNLVQRIHDQISQIRIAIAALALMILGIAAIGISNTMIIAVLERTAEFGIMKALGARHAHVLCLMLLEGAITGVIGGIAALMFSSIIGGLIGRYVRSYIESEISQTYQQPLFAFSFSDIALVFFVAIIVCTLASIFPAIRAARLDPVVAMRRVVS
jgi:putative ABC transport system permease protein